MDTPVESESELLIVAHVLSYSISSLAGIDLVMDIGEVNLTLLEILRRGKEPGVY